VRAKFLSKLDERKIRWLLAVFFLALAIPAVVLIAQAYSQLKWQSFRQNQLLAEDFAARVDADLRAAVATEEARSFGDYSFLVVEGDAAANFVQRSPLSEFPVASAVAGVIGYFQVDAEGSLTTPLLPEGGVDAATYGIALEEQDARRALAESIGDILAQNRLVQREQSVAVTANRALAPRDSGPPQELAEGAESAVSDRAAAEPPAADPVEERRDAAASQFALRQLAAPTLPAAAERTQAAFDRLAAASDDPAEVVAISADLQSSVAQNAAPVAPAVQGAATALEQQLTLARGGASGVRQKRVEQGLEASIVAKVEQEAPAAEAPEPKDVRVRTFESELDPFEVGLLDTGQLVMFRNVWRDGRRYIQGALIDRERFLAGSVRAAFGASSLAGMSDLDIAYQGRSLGVMRAEAGRSYAPTSAELAGSALYRTRLSPPFGNLELIFGVNQLPRAPGSLVLAWVSVTLVAVLCGGFFFMYRFAKSQLRLARQQQDFVSAVSHELKTPLTSIRMYGEMLKAGWADDAKKQVYYDYIHSESERLSRLIENVLQLARLTRSTQHFDMKRATVAELMDMVRSKVGTQVERAGFALAVRNDAPSDEVNVDADCFAQVLINLVDNALKFSAIAERKVVEIASRRESDGRLLITVRDFGPGIPKGQMKKIFELFYRPENELTRETVGTGIGLALVQQLTTAMGGRVDVRNCEPGAEFRLSFPSAP
jgi:signal transduction histidine kinase